MVKTLIFGMTPGFLAPTHTWHRRGVQVVDKGCIFCGNEVEDAFHSRVASSSLQVIWGSSSAHEMNKVTYILSFQQLEDNQEIQEPERILETIRKDRNHKGRKDRNHRVW
ncbi:uncharacterized protein G2W53_014521 [Senna tora]|uniref:Uncharacterized protein n=1 Tax=Senna tora TaxID=362788 RepID=A0A834WTP5_9FABA|nr:uncharacterized protein G2W53_014521 [Senna tora]